jgi:ADP-heptose:LPS heptosyltransferase
VLIRHAAARFAESLQAGRSGFHIPGIARYDPERGLPRSGNRLVNAALDQVRRALIVRIGHLGDSVLATTVIEPLRSACGRNVSIDFAAAPGASAAVLELDRRINRVFPVLRRRLPWRVNRSKQALRSHALSMPYDLVINLECGAECDDFSRFIEYRQFCGRPFTAVQHSLDRHCVDTEKLIYAGLLGAAATRAAQPEIRMHAGDALPEQLAARRHVLLNPGFAGLGIPGYRSHRGWPLEHWCELARMITATTDLTVWVNGTAAERPALEPLLGLPAVRSLVGSTVPELARAIRTAAGVVTVDTGTMHLAAALNTPVIALFGPTIPALTGPYSRTAPCQVLVTGIDCQPCDRSAALKRCRLNRCMSEMPPDRVFTALLKLPPSPTPANGELLQ